MAHHALPDQIADLFNSKRFADVIIRCDDRHWYAHKNVICTQSEFFQKACEGEFKEAEAGYVDLEDDDPLVVDALLMYLYTGDYSDLIVAENSRSLAVFNVQVSALAEKFFVKPLWHAAAHKFTITLTDSWNEDHFSDGIEEWARTTMDPEEILGNRILNIILDRRSELFKPEQRSARVKELIGQIPWLAAETVQMLSLYLEQEKNRHEALQLPQSQVQAHIHGEHGTVQTLQGDLSAMQPSV